MSLRDSNGRFISASTPDNVPINPEFEKPIVQVTVTNPLKKILYWLDQIRRRQTTTFAIKLSIPLIALPVIIFCAFQLGQGSLVLPFMKSQASPTPYSSPSPTPSPTALYSRSGTLKAAKVGENTKYVLALRNGENVLLEVPSTMVLTKYQNKQVLVTGTYNRQANLIKVTEIAEITLFNETTSASPTPTPTPSQTPQATSSAN